MKTVIFLVPFLVVFALYGQVDPETIPLNANERLVETEHGYMFYTYYGDKTLKESQPVILHLHYDTIYRINPMTLEEEMEIREDYFIPYGESAKYDEDGALTEKYNHDSGEYEEYFPDGAIRISGTLKNGLKQDKWRYFNDIYLLTKVAHYEDDLLNGPYQEFYENGQLSVDGAYMLTVAYDTTFQIDPGNLKEKRVVVERLMQTKCGTWTYYEPGSDIPKKTEQFRRCFGSGFKE